MPRIKVVESEEEWEELLASSGGQLIVADFWATWCGPCRMIGPHFERMSDEDHYTDVIFVKVDVDECGFYEPEDHHVEKEQLAATLIVDFDILPSLPAPVIRLQSIPSVSLPAMPGVPPGTKCNCTTRASLQSVIVTEKKEGASDIVIDTQNKSQTDAITIDNCSDDRDEDTVYSVLIPVKGSTYNNMFQQNLKAAKAILANQRTLQVSFKKSTDNFTDRNAIEIVIPSLSKPNSIGFVKGSWLKAVHLSLIHIIDAHVNDILKKWNGVNAYYMADILVYKKGKWPKQDPNYKYNDTI